MTTVACCVKEPFPPSCPYISPGILKFLLYCFMQVTDHKGQKKKKQSKKKTETMSEGPLPELAQDSNPTSSAQDGPSQPLPDAFTSQDHPPSRSHVKERTPSSPTSSLSEQSRCSPHVSTPPQTQEEPGMNGSPPDSPEDPYQPRDSPERPALDVNESMSHSAPQHSSNVPTKSHPSRETSMRPPLSSSNPGSRPSTRHASGSGMKTTQTGHSYDQQEPQDSASGPNAKSFKMAQQQALYLPTSRGHISAIRQNRQKALHPPPTGGNAKGFSRARKPDERFHQSSARPTRVSNDDSKNVNKTNAFASRISKAHSGNASAISSNAGAISTWC